MAKRRSLKELWISIHRWVGLTLGFVLALYCFSGSLVVFAPELELMMMPQLQVAPSAGAPTIGPDQLYAKLQAAYPDKHKSWILQKPSAPGEPYAAEYYAPEERGEAHDKSLIVPFHPTTAEMLHPWIWGEQLVSYIYRFHMTLYLGDVGEDVAGVLALTLTFSALTGIYLWWPRKWSYRAFRVRVGSGWPTFMYDLHNAGGFYISTFLLILAVTGLLIVWPETLSRGIGIVTPVEQVPAFAADRGHGGHAAGAMGDYVPLRLDAAEAAALAMFPGGQVLKTYVPARGETVVRVVIQPPARMTTAEVWFDGPTAKPLYVSDPDERGAGKNIVRSAYPLHNGTAFGLPGRIAILIIGLCPLLLYITGFWLWLRKGGLRRLLNKSPKRIISHAAA